MSIIYTLKKLVDPNAARIEEVRRERTLKKRETPKEGDEPEEFRCRVCKLVCGIREYCPTCLADTMEPYGGEEQ